MTEHWPLSPHAGQDPFDPARVRAHWAVLHAVDCEPLPDERSPHGPALLHAWALFHSGYFQQAEAAGLAIGHDGLSVANRATTAHAVLVEPHEPARLELFRRVHLRACMHAAMQPRNPNAWYWQGYALAQYAQGIHVARALAQGLGTQVRAALEAALMLDDSHAYAHLALGAFHAAAIDKVGALVALVTYGASTETAQRHIQRAHQLAPQSAAVLNGCADALLMLDADAHHAQALHLRQQAVQTPALDVVERLWADMARTSLDM